MIIEKINTYDLKLKIMTKQLLKYDLKIFISLRLVAV